MSRSRKKAIIKDRPRRKKKASLYWRNIRSTIKNSIRSCKNLEDLEIPDPKTIVNDYDYCDYTIDYEFDTEPTKYWSREYILENREKNRRK
jgi:hypothetical protein